MKKNFLKCALSFLLAGVLCFGFAACDGGLSVEEMIDQTVNQAGSANGNGATDGANGDSNGESAGGSDSAGTENGSGEPSGGSGATGGSAGSNDSDTVDMSDGMLQAAENLVSDRVTKEEWDAAFAPENFENVKLYMCYDIWEIDGRTADFKFEVVYTVANGMCYAKVKAYDRNGEVSQGKIPDIGLEEEYIFAGSVCVDKSTEGTFQFPDASNSANAYVKNKSGEWICVESANDDEKLLLGITREWLSVDYLHEALHCYQESEYSEEVKGYDYKARNQNQYGIFKFKNGKPMYFLIRNYNSTAEIVAVATYGGQSVELPQEIIDLIEAD
ncbi:MAG: hypothetical protein NC131_20400 [Roseburia sp.]|nr:hypothetical protein [Roseburia sp.]